MRYYRIEIAPADSAPTTSGGVETVIVTPPLVFTSLLGSGAPNPGALNVLLDVPAYFYAAPDGQASVQIWGIGLDQISQAANLNGRLCAVYAGMSKGLPLANPKQAGLIVQGTINQAFGNWINTDQTLDLILTPRVGSPNDPSNIVLNWPKGTQLSAAIQSALSTAFPNLTPKISISPNLVLSNDEWGFYPSLQEFAAYVKSVSKNIIGGTYPGVDIAISESTFVVSDASTPKTPTLLAFQDFIGQPTWIDPATIQFKMVMRADLALGDFVKFPPALATQSPSSASRFVNPKLTFQGVFLLTSVRHVGNFRQSDAASWVTVFEASTQPVPA
jgi:hypothetical protein